MWDHSNVMEESKHLTNSSWNSAAEKSLKASDYEEWLDPKFTEQEIPSRKAPPVPQVSPPCTSSCLPAICWFVRYSHTRLLSSLPCGQNVAGVSVTWCENISWINNTPEAEQKIRKKQGQHEPTKKSKHTQTHTHTCGHAAFTALRMLNYYIQVCGFMCNSIEIHTNAHTAEFQFSCLSSTIKNMESTSVMFSTSLDLLRRLCAAKRTIFLQIFVWVYKCHTCVASGVTFCARLSPAADIVKDNVRAGKITVVQGRVARISLMHFIAHSICPVVFPRSLHKQTIRGSLQ